MSGAAAAEAEGVGAEEFEQRVYGPLARAARALYGLPTRPAQGPGPGADPHWQAQCLLCADAPVEVALVPCGHALACRQCAGVLAVSSSAPQPVCPVCRTPIQGDPCVLRYV